MRISLVAAAGTLMMTGTALADILYFDNSSGQFVWTESFFLGDFRHGASLDLTQPPSQSGEQATSGFYSFTESFLTSGQLVTTSIVPDYPSLAAVARGPARFLNLGPYSGDVFPAVAFGQGDLIGPVIANGSWQPDADIDYRGGGTSDTLIGGHAFIGLRITHTDGVHYGWVDLQDLGYHANPSFVALGWALETEPGVPIPAGVIPAPASALVLGAALLPLRRRRAR